MPKRKDDLISKQKRLIATRLMQISLLVDDYLYQQKPMSQSSAVTYIKEISGYKDKCYRDVRSLQVIDKLIRCMKGIILEQQELQGKRETGDNYVFQDPFQEVSNKAINVILSPVYSTADEDLTQCIEIDDNIRLGEQIHDKRTDSNNHTDEIETKGVNADIDPFSSTSEERSYLNENVVRHFNKQTERHPLNNNMEVIDLCDDEINVPISQNNALKFRQETDFNIQNAISNLSIIDIDEAFAPFSQECSQSILGDYHPAYSNTANSVQKEKELPLTTNVRQTATIAHEKPVTEIESKEKRPKILLPTTKRIIKVQKPAVNKSMAKQSIVQTALKQTESVKASKPETKKRNIDKNKNAIKISEPSATNTKQTQKQRNVKASDIKHKQNDTTQIANKQSNNQSYTEKQLTYSKTQHSTEPTKKYSKAHKGKTVPIYNRTVENDLSWIENIRFVREISTEEYESFTQGDAIWENCTFPDNWSVDDFNY